jgi:hypothetical protein
VPIVVTKIWRDNTLTVGAASKEGDMISMTKNDSNRPAHKQSKRSQKLNPPLDIFSSRKHSMDYVTKDGVVLRTGYASVVYWYILVVKELLDNAVDFLWKYYPGSANEAIDTSISKNDEVIHIKGSNTNEKNFTVFQNLDLIFNYDMRSGSKQNEYVISRGMLGDAMKQILSFGYVLTHLENDKDAFIDRQWEYPLVIRRNGQEFNVYLHVDKAKEEIYATYGCVGNVKKVNTEIEVTLPISNDLNMTDIAQFCRLYPLLTTDISFNFHLVDNSVNTDTDRPLVGQEHGYEPEKELIVTLSRPEPKAAIIIEYPALHPISKEWNNTSSISYYKKEEFLNRLVRVHDKSLTIHGVLRTTREGSNMAKTNDTSITIGELISDAQREKKVEKLYYRLKSTLPSPTELSLPYRTTIQSKRREAIIDRIVRIYSNLDPKKAVYKAVTGIYHGPSEASYPFTFEIIAIPYSTDLLDINKHRASEFIGMINYSVSPRGNIFDGSYGWRSDRKKKKLVDHFNLDLCDVYDKTANSAKSMLEEEGFCFYEYSGPKTKLPSIIIANLVSPRIDYHGHDKSRVDTGPFISCIIEAIHKIADGIQTFRAAGYTFINESSRRHDTARREQKVSAETIVEEFILKIKAGEV